MASGGTVDHTGGAGATVTWVRHGREAFDVLCDRVAAHRPDPLAPCTVVTPSPAVAVGLRRALAASLGGTAGVRFVDLGALAEELAAARLAADGVAAGVDREVVVAAVRRLLGSRRGRLARIAHHRATWEAAADALLDLAGVPAPVRDELPRAGLVAELLDLLAEVESTVPVGSPSGVARLAAELLDAGEAAVAEVGPVVVHLPGHLAPAQVELLAALARVTPVEVLLGTAGRAADDEAAVRAVAPLVAVPSPPAVAPVAPTEVVSANDVDHEVREAVRALVALAEQGVPWSAMALVHPSGPPYARIVDEVLAEAGVPASGAGTGSLASSVAGRVLLGLLGVGAAGFAREVVVDLWSTGVVVDDAGDLVPFARLDHVSRRLGVTGGGARAWRRAAERDRAQVLARLEDPDDDRPRDVHEQRLDVVDRLRAAVDVLEELLADLPEDWAGLAGWAGTVLDRLCGPVASRVDWPEAELDADAAIRTVLGRLAALAVVEDAPDPAVVRATVREALDRPAPRRRGSGAGLLVTTLDRPPLLPLDAVVVVGLVEGHAPRPGGEDVLLGEEVRAAVGLPTAADRAGAQRRSFDAALASATVHRICTFPRNDQRSGRAQVPSRWVVEGLARATGHRPDTEHLMAGRPMPELDVLRVVPSVEGSLRLVAGGGAVPLDEAERIQAELLVDGAGHPVRTDPVVAAGEVLLAHRRARALTRFDGDLGGDGVDLTTGQRLSPTSLETYATCPRRWFFRHVLGLGEPDRPEEVERLQPTDRGTLVHRVLERFFAEAIASATVPPPGAPWGSSALERLAVICDEECDLLEQRGLTGRALWWAHDRAEIHHVLRTTLAVDVELRAASGLPPVEVEHTFGRDGAPAVPVELEDGRVVQLAGQIDRVDAAGGRAQVWDYKHASATPYEVIRERRDGDDRLGHGRRLQLAAYALAAREATGADEVTAAYWFVKPGHEGRVLGVDLDDDLVARFRAALAVVVDGVAEGRFPARPGEHRWRPSGQGFESCAWCDFDRICPADRDEEWVRVRIDPRLRRFRTLTEEGSAALLADADDTEEIR